MFLQITHVLVNVHCLSVILLYFIHEGLDYLRKLWVLLFDKGFISSELFSDVCEELFEMLLVIHDEFVDDWFVEFKTRELIGVALDNHWS